MRNTTLVAGGLAPEAWHRSESRHNNSEIQNLHHGPTDAATQTKSVARMSWRRRGSAPTHQPLLLRHVSQRPVGEPSGPIYAHRARNTAINTTNPPAGFAQLRGSARIMLKACAMCALHPPQCIQYRKDVQYRAAQFN